MDDLSKTSAEQLSIIPFFENILGIINLSPIQKITLKAIRGEPLDELMPIPKTHPFQAFGFVNEVEMFRHFTGKDEYEPNLYSDASLCFGRRSGKSTTIGAGLAIFYATQFDYTPYLGTSPHATIPIISPTKEQAGEVFAAIKNFFLRNPWLLQKFLEGNIDRIVNEYSEEDLKNPSRIVGGQIKLTNKVIIKVMAADVSRVRGWAVPFAILDEVCWFGSEGADTKNTDKAISEALEPALAQFQTVEGMALVLKISSPNGQSGLMYGDYDNRKDQDVLHIQAPTWYANPSIAVRYLEKQKKKGMNYFNREYGAEYTASETAYLDPNLIELAVLKGIEKVDVQKGYRYVAAIDYATRNDLWTLAIGHKEFVLDTDIKEKIERVYADFLIHWRGSDGAELDPSEVIPEICMYLKAYSVTHCMSDQYAFAALKPYFSKEGCLLKEFTMSNQSKIKMMNSLQVALNTKTFKMCANATAVQHLKDLRERRGRQRIQIEAANNCHDDYAMSIGLVVYQFDRTSPIYIGYHRDDEDVVPSTKDALGNQVLTPTAQDLADYVGLAGFYDNRKEHEKKKDDDDDGNDDPDGFWFTF
jgi:hypothetical protein